MATSLGRRAPRFRHGAGRPTHRQRSEPARARKSPPAGGQFLALSFFEAGLARERPVVTNGPLAHLAKRASRGVLHCCTQAAHKRIAPDGPLTPGPGAAARFFALRVVTL